MRQVPAIGRERGAAVPLVDQRNEARGLAHRSGVEIERDRIDSPVVDGEVVKETPRVGKGIHISEISYVVPDETRLARWPPIHDSLVPKVSKATAIAFKDDAGPIRRKHRFA